MYSYNFADFQFSEDFAYKKLCTVQLSGEDLKRMTEAVEDLYYFEFTFGNRRLLLYCS